MKKAVIFDLFFTLADLEYQRENEFTLLGISRRQWEQAAEKPAVYNHRATGKVKNEEEMINSMVSRLPIVPDGSQKDRLLQIRNSRMKKALTEIHPDILSTLDRLKKTGIKIGLVSNADLIDKKYWPVSPLKDYFDRVIFSCDVGIVKPDLKIYQLAAQQLGIQPADCLFVGDGGSDELAGAKSAGMSTVLTEFLAVKDPQTREKIIKSADYQVADFRKIFDIAVK